MKNKFNKITTELSREIINFLKKKQKSHKSHATLFSRTHIEVFAEFIYDRKPNKFSVAGAAYIHDNMIKLVIKMNKKTHMKDMVGIVAELKNTIRHEIEHFAQKKFKDRERKGLFKTPDADDKLTMFEYLSMPYENHAWVVGMYTEAKTLKVPLDVIFDKELVDKLRPIKNKDKKMKNFLTHKECLTIKKKWIKYAKKRFPNAVWSNKKTK